MWDSFLNISGDLWESVSEGVTEYVDGFVDYQETQKQEAAKDPNNLKQHEPVKGQLADGSTVVATTAAPVQTVAPQPAAKQWVAGVDNTVVVVGGAGALVALALILR